jgi:hypothetical protein
MEHYSSALSACPNGIALNQYTLVVLLQPVEEEYPTPSGGKSGVLWEDSNSMRE